MKSTASIAFVTKALYQEVAPKYASVKGQLKTKSNNWRCEQKLIVSHLQEHKNTSKSLIKE